MVNGTPRQVEVTFGDDHKEFRWVLDYHKCDNCNKLFEPVCPRDDGTTNTIQPLHALEMRFVPYYGGYFDNLSVAMSRRGPGSFPYTMIANFWFCESCADDLLEEYPCFKSMIKETKPHGTFPVDPEEKPI